MGYGGNESIHQTKWPDRIDFPEFEKIDSTIFTLGSKSLSAIHSCKSEKGVSLKTPVKIAEITLNDEENKIFGYCRSDLMRAGWIDEIKININSNGFKLNAEM